MPTEVKSKMDGCCEVFLKILKGFNVLCGKIKPCCTSVYCGEAKAVFPMVGLTVMGKAD